MPNNEIQLGDEIEDITAKVTGIVVGMMKYLDGSEAYLIQPPFLPDGTRIATVEVQAPYARRTGKGVYPEPKPPIGFHAEKES